MTGADRETPRLLDFLIGLGTPRFIARQLAQPKGWRGRIMGRLMNRTNAEINAFALEQLAVARTDRIIEVGFGGGGVLPAMIANAAFVAAVDPSQDMVARAQCRHSRVVSAGRAAFHVGDVATLPFPDASFHKAYTVNTVYFWRCLDLGLAELHRVLVPGGRLVIGFYPKEQMERMRLPADIFTFRALPDLLAALGRAGFGAADVTQPNSRTPWRIIVVGRRQK
jgi:SAM-dependent methyltransferase